MQNIHQAELIAQLRQEAQQWKGPCLCLEETSRGEINAWKDHQFLRIDAEQTRPLNQLSSQVRQLNNMPPRAASLPCPGPTIGYAHTV